MMGVANQAIADVQQALDLQKDNVNPLLMAEKYLLGVFLFFSLRYGFLHFLHLVASISFLAPQSKQILITSLACCAILFFSGSVIGI